MNRGKLLRIRELRALCVSTLDQIPWPDARETFHPDLSPAAWHVGHAFYTEAFWLAETTWQDDSLTAAWREFQADAGPKHSRATRLPDEARLRDWCALVGMHCDALWSRAVPGQHLLMADGYLEDFVIQHYCQHLETLCMVRQQRQLKCDHPGPPPTRLQERPAGRPGLRELGACRVRIGAQKITAPYDNELQPHEVEVAAVRIAAQPVSNAEWLAFMTSTGARSPQHWRGEMTKGWYGIDESGVVELEPAAPVEGLSHDDATGYAHWVGARLPHEHEWEAAARAGVLDDTGIVWEWCANSLMPYPGFKPFPYEGYSVPWFDGAHYVLRGGSRRTQPEIRRPSFRNFYPPGHRHVYAGLRLVFE